MRYRRENRGYDHSLGARTTTRNGDRRVTVWPSADNRNIPIGPNAVCRPGFWMIGGGSCSRGPASTAWRPMGRGKNRCDRSTAGDDDDTAKRLVFFFRECRWPCRCGDGKKGTENGFILCSNTSWGTINGRKSHSANCPPRKRVSSRVCWRVIFFFSGRLRHRHRGTRWACVFRWRGADVPCMCACIISLIIKPQCALVRNDWLL